VLSHRDIARALLIEASADLEAARVLRQAGVYARCVAHCQHAVYRQTQTRRGGRGGRPSLKL
jgi:hypothetical protein